jgi:hypothetical protein
MGKSLNDIMEFDHVIQVLEDGTILDEVEGVWAPEIHSDAEWDEYGDAHVSDANERDLVTYVRTQGWDLFQGRVSHGVSLGPVIDSSYFIGGSLEERIRETPGYWVAVTVDVQPDDEDAESQPHGWALAHREK